MYTDFFGLREAPFSITPDPRFYCANSGCDQAYSALVSALRGKKSVLLLTGEAGCGKTTLLRKLIDELETSLRFVYLNYANLQFEDLIALVCANLGIVCSSRGQISALRDYLVAQRKAGNGVVLIVDEAQNLPDRAFSGLKTLIQTPSAKGPLLQLVLAGQRELEVRLGHSPLADFRNDIDVWCQLAPLDKGEVRGFIRHRLKFAGHSGDIPMTPDAIERITDYSRGIPRLINAICDKALLAASQDQRDEISSDIVVEVAEHICVGALPDHDSMAAAGAAEVFPNADGAPLESEEQPKATKNKSDVNENDTTRPPAARRSAARLAIFTCAVVTVAVIGVLYFRTADAAVGQLGAEIFQSTDLSQRLANARQLLDAHEARIAAQGEKIETLTRERDDMVQTHRLKMAEITKEHDDLARAFAETSANAKANQSDAEGLRANLSTISAQAEDSIAQLRAELKAANRETEDLRARLAKVEASRAATASRDIGNDERSGQAVDSPSSKSDPATRIALLLARGKEQIAAKHLTLPESDNALLTYQEILRIAPDHEIAQSRIQWIAKQFRIWAAAAVERGDRTKALFYFQRLLVVEPEDEAAREALLGLITPGGKNPSPTENEDVAPPASVWGTDPANRATTLFTAVTGGNVRALDQILKQSVSIDVKAEDGSTALFTAVRSDNQPMVDALIDRGAQVNAQDYDGDSPLSVSARQRNSDIVQALLSKGAKVDSRNYDGKTPLMEAAWHGHAEAALELVYRGATINATDDAGRSALHHSVGNGRLDVAQALLVHGANVNLRDGDGWTALMSAAKNGDLATVRALMDHGADVDAANQKGNTALTIAVDGGYSEIANILRGELP